MSITLKIKIYIYDAILKDTNNNNFSFKFANIDLVNQALTGKDIFINLNNEFLNPENEPRLKGKTLTYKENISKINNGVFYNL